MYLFSCALISIFQRDCVSFNSSVLVFLFADGFESSEGKGKMPTFSIPSLSPLTECALLLKSADLF